MSPPNDAMSISNMPSLHTPQAGCLHIAHP